MLGTYAFASKFLGVTTSLANSRLAEQQDDVDQLNVVAFYSGEVILCGRSTRVKFTAISHPKTLKDPLFFKLSYDTQ